MDAIVRRKTLISEVKKFFFLLDKLTSSNGFSFMTVSSIDWLKNYSKDNLLVIFTSELLKIMGCKKRDVRLRLPLKSHSKSSKYYKNIVM